MHVWQAEVVRELTDERDRLAATIEQLQREQIEAEFAEEAVDDPVVPAEGEAPEWVREVADVRRGGFFEKCAKLVGAFWGSSYSSTNAMCYELYRHSHIFASRVDAAINVINNKGKGKGKGGKGKGGKKWSRLADSNAVLIVFVNSVRFLFIIYDFLWKTGSEFMIAIADVGVRLTGLLLHTIYNVMWLVVLIYIYIYICIYVCIRIYVYAVM